MNCGHFYILDYDKYFDFGYHSVEEIKIPLKCFRCPETKEFTKDQYVEHLKERGFE